MANDKKLRWSGRNEAKDQLRSRIWSTLEQANAGVGKVWDSIPNYSGADDAAERLSQLPFWVQAKVIKSNPDDAQIPVRYRALRDGKLLYMPVPELVEQFPFVLLDPARLKSKGVSFETAATIEGALAHGQKVQFTEMLPMDVLVVGCVAAAPNGGRTGKGAGFADLEIGIFREVGTVPAHAQVVTTVHDLQVVEGSELPLQAHDSPLDWIVTSTQVFETRSSHPRPRGVDWDAVRPEQYSSISFLLSLREELRAK